MSSLCRTLPVALSPFDNRRVVRVALSPATSIVRVTSAQTALWLVLHNTALLSTALFRQAFGSKPVSCICVARRDVRAELSERLCHYPTPVAVSTRFGLRLDAWAASHRRFVRGAAQCTIGARWKIRFRPLLIALTLGTFYVKLSHSSGPSASRFVRFDESVSTPAAIAIVWIVVIPNHLLTHGTLVSRARSVKYLHCHAAIGSEMITHLLFNHFFPWRRWLRTVAWEGRRRRIVSRLKRYCRWSQGLWQSRSILTVFSSSATRLTLPSNSVDVG